MNTAMYDAREAMVPGSMYDRSGQLNGSAPPPSQCFRGKLRNFLIYLYDYIYIHINLYNEFITFFAIC